MSNVADNYQEMCKRLDAKYSNVSKLVDSILSDVKKLPPISANPLDVLNMINIVEKAWRAEIIRSN